MHRRGCRRMFGVPWRAGSSEPRRMVLRRTLRILCRLFVRVGGVCVDRHGVQRFPEDGAESRRGLASHPDTVPGPARRFAQCHALDELAHS